MLTRETLATLIDEVGLTDLKRKILDMAKPSIRMISTPVEDESEIPVGASKLGGLPDMPPGAEYPHHKGKALGFVAQINLADLPDHPEGDRLPSSGLLQFFYRDYFGPDTDHSPEAEIDKARVFYYDIDSKLFKRTSPPDTYDWVIYDPCKLNYEDEFTIPPYESYFVEHVLGLTYGSHDPNNEKYMKLAHRCWEVQESKTFNRISGHPHLVQGDVLAEAYALTKGKSFIPRADDKPEFHEWEMLVQIDSDNNANMMWGDVGIIYYCIKKNDLDVRRFDQAVCVAQCA